MINDDAYALVEQLFHGCCMLLATWELSGFGPEGIFARNVTVKSAGIRDDEREGIISFGTPGGLAHWRFPLELGPSFAAAKLALDIREPLSEPDSEGLRWLGEG